MLVLIDNFRSHLHAQLPVPQTTPDPATLGCGTPPFSCPASKYRSYDGSCNNLGNPVLGTPQTRYARLLPAVYGDSNF